jgi:hypothetical protein
MDKKACAARLSRGRGEKGLVLVYTLLVLLVLVILSILGMLTTTTELRIATNDRSAKEVFYLAEESKTPGHALQATPALPRRQFPQCQLEVFHAARPELWQRVQGPMAIIPGTIH